MTLCDSLEAKTIQCYPTQSYVTQPDSCNQYDLRYNLI